MDNSQKIVVKLIHCGNSNFLVKNDNVQKNLFFMPMGLLLLAEVLHKHNFDVEVIHSDLETGKGIDDILDYNSIQLIGFDCHWVNQSLTVLKTAEYIKSKNKLIFIFLGGFTASLFANEIISNYKCIDAVITGDGENPILELCNTYRSYTKCDIIDKIQRDHVNYEEVPNLVWRKNGEVLINKATYIAQASDINAYSFAKFELLRNRELYIELSGFYSHFTPINTHSMFLLEIGRGCEYLCAFCGGNCLAQKKINKRSKVFFRDIGSVLNSIQESHKIGFRTYYISLENGSSDEYYKELFKEIHKLNLPLFLAFGAWKLPSKNLIDVISKTWSQSVIEISVESSNEIIRKKNIDKRIYFSNKDLEKCLDYISTKGNIKAQVFFGYFLSGDSTESIFETIEYILYILCKYPNLLEIEYSNFSTDPGSMYYFNPEKYDLNIRVQNLDDYLTQIQKRYVETKNSPADMTLFKPNSMDNEEVNKVNLRISILNYLFKNYRNTVTLYFEEHNNLDFISKLFAVFVENTTEGINSEISQEIFNQLIDLLQNSTEKIVIALLNEFEKTKTSVSISRPTTQLYMDKISSLEYIEKCDKSILQTYFVDRNREKAQHIKTDQGSFNF